MGDARSSHRDGHEDVIFFSDQETGLRGITVFDEVGSGPCVGACRSRPYIEEERAIADALRQARTTTAKALIAGLPVSGGCTVLLSESPIGVRVASPMTALGRAVEALGGRYRLLPDLQGDLKDMDQATIGTGYVLGRRSEICMDPVDASALGLRYGIEATARRRLQRNNLMGVRIGILGLGAVGFRLAEILRLEGARVTVADRDPRRTERAVRALGISCVATEEIIHLDLDVLAPTAAKDTIDESVLPHLRCSIVAGAVDDPLSVPKLATALHDRGILYAPDRVINAGGLISLVQPLMSWGEMSVSLDEQLRAIGTRMERVIDRALEEDLPTSVIVESLVKEAVAKRRTLEPVDAIAS